MLETIFRSLEASLDSPHVEGDNPKTSFRVARVTERAVPRIPPGNDSFGHGSGGRSSAPATVLREASKAFILHTGEAVAVQDLSRSWQAEPSATGEPGQGSPCYPCSRVHSSVMICNSCAGS